MTKDNSVVGCSLGYVRVRMLGLGNILVWGVENRMGILCCHESREELYLGVGWWWGVGRRGK